MFQKNDALAFVIAGLIVIFLINYSFGGAMINNNENKIAVAADPRGMIVHVKEKYGATVIIECTAVVFDHELQSWYITKREGSSDIFPKENYSISFPAKGEK